MDGDQRGQASTRRTERRPRAARQHLEIDRQVRAYYRELGRLERAREEVDILQSRLRFAHETLRKRHGLDQTPVPPPRVWDDDDIPF